MPEGPEIRRAADAIERVLRGQTVDSLYFGLRGLQRFRGKLQGKRVASIETRGKAMLTHFEHGWSIYSHNQLYGVWKIVKRGETPATNRQLRLALHTAKHSALLFSASDISVWKTTELDSHPFLGKIGPDILNRELTWRDISKRLADKQFSGRKLSALYLDQAFLAGLGNYLRSEILFAAGLDPRLRARDLNAAARNRLARNTLQVARRSYQHDGVTLTQKQYRYLREQGNSHGKSRFMVFGRAGVACRVCDRKIRRIEEGSRRLYFCPACQAN